MEQIPGFLMGVVVAFGAWYWAKYIPLSRHERWWYEHVHGMDEDRADRFRQGSVVVFIIVFVGIVILKIIGLSFGLKF
jgi:hypothetical protein